MRVGLFESSGDLCDLGWVGDGGNVVSEWFSCE